MKMRVSHLHILCSLFVGMLVLTALQFSCTPKIRSKPKLHQEVSVAKSIEDALDTCDFERSEWIKENWWEMFSDEKLNKCVQTAIVNNPSLQASIETTLAAEQEARSQKSILFPQLSANLTDGWEHLSRESLYRYPPSVIPPVVNQVDLTLNFNYEFDFFGKYRNRYYAALGVARAKAAEAYQSKLLISIQVAKSYFDIQYLRNKYAIICDQLEDQITSLELTNERVAHALDDQMQLQKIKSRVDSIKQSVIDVEKEIIIAKHQLARLMGSGPDTQIDVEVSMSTYDKKFPLPEDLSLNLVARRPDLMSQIWLVDSHAKKVGAAKAAFYPNINLGAKTGFESLSWGNLFSIHNWVGKLVPAIDLPIYTGGRLSANYKREVAEFFGAIYVYNDMLLKAAQEVSDGVVTYSAIKDQEFLQTKKVNSSREIYSLRLKRYESCVDNLLQVLGVKEEFESEKIKLLDLGYQRQLSILKLIKSLGGGYSGVEPKEVLKDKNNG